MRNLFLYKLGKIKARGKKKKYTKDDVHAQHENYMARCAAYFFFSFSTRGKAR